MQSLFENEDREFYAAGVSRKNPLKPSLEDPLRKREQFAVALRKDKNRQQLMERRKRLREGALKGDSIVLRYVDGNLSSTINFDKSEKAGRPSLEA